MLLRLRLCLVQPEDRIPAPCLSWFGLRESRSSYYVSLHHSLRVFVALVRVIPRQLLAECNLFPKVSFPRALFPRPVSPRPLNVLVCKRSKTGKGNLANAKHQNRVLEKRIHWEERLRHSTDSVVGSGFAFFFVGNRSLASIYCLCF